MGVEVLPSNAAAYDERTVRTRPVGGRITTQVIYSGTKAALEALETSLHAGTVGLTGLASTVLDVGAGRGTLTASYERGASQKPGQIPGIEEAIQELRPVEITRDIYLAEYFATLTNAQIQAVRDTFERSETAPATFSELQQSLLGHLTHGQDSYLYTAYEFSQTWKTTSDKRIGKSMLYANRIDKSGSVKLNDTMKLLITTLKFDNGTTLIDGEWLKKPTEVTHLGKGFYLVSEKWIGLPKWSVIYGGSFTGLDPA